MDVTTEDRDIQAVVQVPGPDHDLNLDALVPGPDHPLIADHQSDVVGPDPMTHTRDPSSKIIVEEGVAFVEVDHFVAEGGADRLNGTDSRRVVGASLEVALDPGPEVAAKVVVGIQGVVLHPDPRPALLDPKRNLKRHSQPKRLRRNIPSPKISLLNLEKSR